MKTTMFPLLLAACGSDAPSGPSVAERIEKERRYLRSMKAQVPFPGDRLKLVRLHKRARSETPPDKPRDGDLEEDIAHVLSRHVAIAIPVELTMPQVPVGDSGEF